MEWYRLKWLQKLGGGPIILFKLKTVQKLSTPRDVDLVGIGDVSRQRMGIS